MKKFFLHIFLVGVLGMLTVSCNDTEMVEYLDTNTTQVMFSLGMDSPVTRTRATKATDDTWGSYSPSDGGDAYDNRINPDQLYVKITHGGKTYDVKKILKWQDKDDASLHTFVGEVDIDLKGQTKTMENAKIEVFANWNPDAENGGVFSQSADYIPMWGVQTATITLAPGKRETLSTIYLLRAMAKIQVSLGDEMAKEYTLSSVTLNKHNPTGNCLPTGAAGAENTKDLGLEAVLNAEMPNDNTPLAFKKDGDSYVVYLPEVVNDGTTDDDLLKITVQLQEKNGSNTEEGSFFIKDYSDEDNPVAIDIIRNHWYKYIVKGFAASQIFVDYKALDWQGVGMEIGGDGFLFLSKDVVEIYNSNIDADQLKFSSSSPIKSITLKDIYKHERNGSFTEGTLDGVYAYYMDKFGVLTQLSAEEGTDEATVLANISATVKEENKKVLNGGIVINSPFMADKDASETALQSDSHYNTVRYLEFEVENEQGLKATFRVMQYPPVVITNEEGFFSYRDDFRRTDDEEPAHYMNYKGYGSISTMGLHLYHEHDWTDEVEQDADWWAIRQSDRNYKFLSKPSGTYPWLGKSDNSCPDQGKTGDDWEEVRYSTIAYDVTFISHEAATKDKELTYTYGGAYRSIEEPTDYFFRERYWNLPGAASAKMEKQGVAIGPYYQKEVMIDGVPTKRVFRKHYSWNIQTIFWSKFVQNVYKEDGYNSNSRRRLKGQADICSIGDPNEPGYTATDFEVYSQGRLWRNHRMYHIKSTVSTNGVVLGFPTLVDENGNPTQDADRGATANTPSNANLVSPSFVVASQLGETNYNYIVDACKQYKYVLPTLSNFYKLAERHCREYVEASYDDSNGNGQYDEGETITHYHDWRLPTKAEIEMIIGYQNNSRAMDKVLLGEHFVCITGNPGAGDNEEYWVSSEVPGYKVSAQEDLDGIAYDNFGYYIRCVRDVKE